MRATDRNSNIQGSTASRSAAARASRDVDVDESGQTRAGRVKPDRPKLEVVDNGVLRRRNRRRLLLGLSAGVVAFGLFAVALVYAQLAQGQSQLDNVRAEISQSSADLARLESAVVRASSPDAVVARAAELGMVRAQDPVYLISSGSSDPVVGSAPGDGYLAGAGS